MRITIQGRVLTVHKEQGDMRISSESQLLYHVRLKLIAAGVDAIKKRMWKDGHMVSDHCQYVRTRKYDGDKVGFAVYDGNYAIRDTHEDYNKDGKVEYNIDGVVPDEIKAKFGVT